MSLALRFYILHITLALLPALLSHLAWLADFPLLICWPDLYTFDVCNLRDSVWSSIRFGYLIIVLCLSILTPFISNVTVNKRFTNDVIVFERQNARASFALSRALCDSNKTLSKLLRTTPQSHAFRVRSRNRALYCSTYTVVGQEGTRAA